MSDINKTRFSDACNKSKRRPGGRLLPLAVIFILLVSSVFIAGCGDSEKTGDTDQPQKISAVSDDGGNDSAKDTKKEEKKSSKDKKKDSKKNEKAEKKSSDSGDKRSSKNDGKTGSGKSKEKASSDKVSPGKKSSSGDKSSSGHSKKKKTAKYCYFKVTCHTLVPIKDELPSSLQKLIPDSGVIVSRTKVKLKSGDDAFEVTKRTLRKKGVHLSYQGTTQYGTAYVEAINNIYEKDVNSRSGWIYKVNGTAPGVGCSAYKIKKNDVIEWAYTCDLGEDL